MPEVGEVEEFSPKSKGLEAKMAGPSDPTPPSNSSALAFKSNASGPSPGHEPAVGSLASTEAAAPEAHVPSDPVVAVLGVVEELRARGFLAGLETPEAAELTGARVAGLFDGVLAAFLAAAGAPSLPPLALADGRKVELLRMFLAVRAHGGFAAVASWSAIAEAAGLDPSADAVVVKLLYCKYLALLEHSIGKPRGDQEVESSGNADRRLGSEEDRFVAPAKGPTTAGSAQLKRKRDPLVGMLNWVRLVAKNPDGPGVTGRKRERDSHIFTALMLRDHMFLNKDCRSGSLSSQNIDRISPPPIRHSGQADIPEWKGKPSLPYDDPHALKFLGEPILLPKASEDLDIGSIGKGRQDDCNCQFQGSIACVRFHVAEKKIELKRELGSAFYEMGFHHMGEDLALTWTKDEERKFNTTIQENLIPSKSRYNLWDKLLSVFRTKGREGLVSYYHNVFQVWRRAYQNRLAPNSPDSDDGSVEPGFLYLHQGRGQSSSSSSATSRTRRNY
nr:unnamed protein product [Digitaria exilis]